MPGPGTELKRILDALPKAPPNCPLCNAEMKRMNRLGVEGCEREFDAIVNTVALNATKVGGLYASIASGASKTRITNYLLKKLIARHVRAAINAAKKS